MLRRIMLAATFAAALGMGGLGLTGSATAHGHGGWHHRGFYGPPARYYYGYGPRYYGYYGPRYYGAYYAPYYGSYGSAYIPFGHHRGGVYFSLGF